MKKCVAQAERSQNPTHGLCIKPEFFLDILSCDAEIKAINVGEACGDCQE
jgi:hypothetical protein